MNDNKEERILEIVTGALDRDGTQRASFLAQACNGDNDLRAEVDSLLEQQESVGDFIEERPTALAAEALRLVEDDFFAGKRIGHYRLLRKIGRGGMGAVYLAERDDQEYRKQVAIKLITFGLDFDEVHQRFRHERQILATLDHPNIAKLLDGGTTEEGLPYFVMDFVDGVPLDQYCDSRKLTTIERLELFRSICAAVHYAHQNLVIHRDIKPGNILVTAEGVPKLLDFGIAKMLRPDSSMTFAGTIAEMKALTPEYASPEQIKGEKITTASDTYSLGVVLYGLLTGQRPYRLKTSRPDELSHAICEEEPISPSTAAAKGDGSSKSQILNLKLLRGDLDNIVLMAMRKEPARRYASVAQFAEDIRRHLCGRPVIARKDTWTYRSGKFIRRNKLAVAAAVLIAFSLIGGIIATLWQADRATRQASFAAKQRDRAERRFQDVRHLSNALLFEIAPRIERLEGSTEARSSLVRRALEYLDSLAKESAGDYQLQAELATAYEKVGELQGSPRKPNLNDFSGAIASYEKARDIRKRLLKVHPDNVENLRRFAGDLSALSSIRWWTSDTSGSLDDSQRALQAYEKLLSIEAGSFPLKLATAEAQIDLSNTYYYNDQLSKVYLLLKKALGTLEILRQADPDNIEILRLIGRGLTTLSMTLSWDGKQTEAEGEMTRALAINESLATNHPRDGILRQGLLESYLQSSQLYEDSEPARSLDILLKARALVEESISNDAANIQARQNLAKTYSRLGVIALRLGKLGEAVADLEKSSRNFAELEKIDPHHRTYSHDEGRVLMFLGQAQHQQRKFREALASYNRASTLFEAIIRADPQNNLPVHKLATLRTYLAETHRDFAQTLSGAEKQSQLRAAKEDYDRAVSLFQGLQSKNALTQYDLKEMEAVRAAASEFQRIGDETR